MQATNGNMQGEVVLADRRCSVLAILSPDTWPGLEWSGTWPRRNVALPIASPVKAPSGFRILLQ